MADLKLYCNKYMKFIESILLENIDKPCSLFVFPTDTAASRWADHILRIRGGTIAMNKFTAWDNFKQNSIKSKVQGRKSIPSALRKIFMSRLIRENADAAANGKETIFSSLINVSWAQHASQFSPWLTRILPQLGAWFKITTGFSIDSILDTNKNNLYCNFENDEKDMYNMAVRYAQFLKTHSFFEPAWETPPFNNDGKEVFLMFPESLSDYREYSGLLSASDHVKIIRAPDTEQLPGDSFFYTNARSEIAEASLYIRALYENKNIPWDSIAVCIPDSADYEPYVLREFTNRNIPFVKRISKPLADYPAGRFFRSLLDCVSQDFSFSSVVSLIRNRNLPWKESELIDKLIQFGIDNNCLYSWEEEKDETSGGKELINVWEDAFAQPIGYSDSDIRNFFNNLKKRITVLRSAPSFSEIRKQYFIFREYFFDMEKCSEETDLVLSRCITELMNLAELEKSYPDISAADAFLFLAEYLSEIYYLPQAKSTGVAILPYKTAAAAPFNCHIILGAGQDNLSVINKRLDFLPKKRRAELGISDEDASDAFIDMHKYNSAVISAFFCCEKTFSGYSIPHSRINSFQKPNDRYAEISGYGNKFAPDFYKTESLILSSFSSEAQTVKTGGFNLHENQAKGFNEWQNRRFSSAESNKKIEFSNIKIRKIIDECYAKTGKYSVSATSLQTYFQCSLKWLYERVFALENLQIETGLMSENVSGLIYHAILNDFFNKIKNTGSALAEPEYKGATPVLPASYCQLLDESVNAIFNCFPSLQQGGTRQMSSLSTRLLNAGKNDYRYNLKNCLSHFLAYFAGCTIEESECYYQAEKETFIMRGVVDCILKEHIASAAPKQNDGGNNEKYIIIDFKLKKTPRRKDCTAEEGNPLADFQLPMYITLAEENKNFKVYTALFHSILDRQSEVVIGKIHNEKTNKTIPRGRDDQINPESEWYNMIFDEFKNKTKQFTQEISSGDFTVYPEKSGSCFSCEYRRICRTTYIIKSENKLLEKH